jgi:hypothetical protein
VVMLIVFGIAVANHLRDFPRGLFSEHPAMTTR